MKAVKRDHARPHEGELSRQMRACRRKSSSTDKAPLAAMIQKLIYVFSYSCDIRDAARMRVAHVV